MVAHEAGPTDIRVVFRKSDPVVIMAVFAFFQTGLLGILQIKGVENLMVVIIGDRCCGPGLRWFPEKNGVESAAER